MEERIKLLISELGELRVRRDVDVSEYLLTNLGGLAEAFYIATTSRELVKAIEICRELKIDYFLIGSGSKVAISEKRVRGLVIKNRSDNIKISGVRGKVSDKGLGIEEAILEIDSGVSIQRLCDFADAQNLTGVEILRGIIGTIGGNLFINPALKRMVEQVRIITKIGASKIIKTADMVRLDVILSVIMKLRTKKG